MINKNIESFEDRKKKLSNILKKSNWLINLSNNFDDYCLGGCNQNRFRNICYNGIELNLCYDCLIDKYNILEKKYNINNKYLFSK